MTNSQYKVFGMVRILILITLQANISYHYKIPTWNEIRQVSWPKDLVQPPAHPTPPSTTSAP